MGDSTTSRKGLGWLYQVKLVASIAYDLTIALVTFPSVLGAYYLRLPSSLPSIRDKESLGDYKSAYLHEQDIKRVSASVSKAFAAKKLVVLHRKPGHGHSARSAHYKAGHHAVDVASLTSILELDKKTQTITVQAGISFEALCKETLKHDLLPLVVPEFKSITVGGAIQGIGIESSSWHNGAVDETVVTATLVLGNGDVVQSDAVPELWKHVPGSNGSLALVVAAKLRLRAAGQYVKIEYSVQENFEDFRHLVDRSMSQEVSRDWSWYDSSALIDAVLIRNVGVVTMSAACTNLDNAQKRIAKIYKETPFSPFFFQHVAQIGTRLSHEQDKGTKDESYVEHMPTMQYLFRYDRGGFWGIMALGKMFPVLNFVLQRPLLTGCLNHFLKTATLYKVAMLLPDFDRESVAMLQDVDLPQNRAAEIVDWALRHEIEYLWLCPVRNQSASVFAVSGGQEWILNIGIYGTITGLPHSNKELQRLVATCQGKVALYAHVYVDALEFWSWYDHDRYLQLRDEFHGHSFMDVYQKVGGISKLLI